MASKLWTIEEEEQLMELGPKMGLSEIAKRLGRSESAVKFKSYKLGVKIGGQHKRFKGCDEDCFNCPYPDCYRPASACALGGRW